MLELTGDAFLVRRSVRTVPRADTTSHLERVSPSAWQATPCDRVGKAAEGGHDLAYRRLTFVTPDDVSRLLNTSRNILEVGQLLVPNLVDWASPFKEMLNWLQFVYTVERTGAYVAPVSTVLIPSVESEGDPLFPSFWRHLLRRFTGAYAPTLTMCGPLSTEYLG